MTLHAKFHVNLQKGGFSANRWNIRKIFIAIYLLFFLQITYRSDTLSDFCVRWSKVTIHCRGEAARHGAVLSVTLTFWPWKWSSGCTYHGVPSYQFWTPYVVTLLRQRAKTWRTDRRTHKAKGPCHGNEVTHARRREALMSTAKYKGNRTKGSRGYGDFLPHA